MEALELFDLCANAIKYIYFKFKMYLKVILTSHEPILNLN